MQSLGSQDVALDQRMKRLQGGCAGADQVGHRRHAQIDAFAPVPFALAVQRLMLAELNPQPLSLLKRSGYFEVLGEHNVFSRLEDAYAQV